MVQHQLQNVDSIAIQNTLKRLQQTHAAQH